MEHKPKVEEGSNKEQRVFNIEHLVDVANILANLRDRFSQEISGDALEMVKRASRLMEGELEKHFSGKSR